jgi:hypothetical protein
VTDMSFDVPLPCTATPSGTDGATCAVTTTADAIVPGSVPEGMRSIWQLGPVEVYDGGDDGLLSTGDNDLFATQGVFVP